VHICCLVRRVVKVLCCCSELPQARAQDTGLGEEDASPRATAESAVQFLHKSASDFHEDIKVGLREVNWRATMRAVTNKNARFLSRLNRITNGQVDGQEGLDDPFTDTSVQPQVRDIVPQQLTSNISKLSPGSSFHSAKTNCHSLPAPTILCPDLVL